MKSIQDIIALLKKILQDKKNRPKLVREFEETIWFEQYSNLSHEAIVVLDDLENDIGLYDRLLDPSDMADASVTTDSEVVFEVRKALDKLSKIEHIESTGNRMRDRSVHFFMSRGDEELFIKLVLSIPELAIIKSGYFTENARPHSIDEIGEYFESFKDRENEENSKWLILANVYGKFSIVFHPVVGSSDSNSGEMMEIKDHRLNTIISYTRCYIEKGKLTEGRLVFREKHIDEKGNVYKKSQKLTKIYEKLAGWIRKNSVRASRDNEKPAFNLYILPGALDYYRGGGILGIQDSLTPFYS
jgi:hypothetical protein